MKLYSYVHVCSYTNLTCYEGYMRIKMYKNCSNMYACMKTYSSQHILFISILLDIVAQNQPNQFMYMQIYITHCTISCNEIVLSLLSLQGVKGHTTILRMCKGESLENINLVMPSLSSLLQL